MNKFIAIFFLLLSSFLIMNCSDSGNSPVIDSSDPYEVTWDNIYDSSVSYPDVNLEEYAKSTCEDSSENPLSGITIEVFNLDADYNLEDVTDKLHTLYVKITVSNKISDIRVGDSCEGPDKDGLFMKYQIDGNGHHYAIDDDTGMCPWGINDRETQVEAGVYVRGWNWVARDYHGQSDYGAMPSEKFTAGTYTLKAKFYGLDNENQREFFNEIECEFKLE